MRTASCAPAGTRNAAPAAGCGSWPGSHRASTCSGTGDAALASGEPDTPPEPANEMVALRTIDGVPGSRSTARTQRGSFVPIGTTNSCQSSTLSAATVNSDGKGSATSGAPIDHSFLSAIVGSF